MLFGIFAPPFRMSFCNDKVKESMRRLLRLLYLLRLRRPYPTIDRIHYLKRLGRGRRLTEDDLYCSGKDLEQFRDGEVLIHSVFRDRSVLFLCDHRAHVERGIIREGLYDAHVLQFMVSYARPGTIVIDVGANIGAYAIPFAVACPDVGVHAFEPHPMAVSRFKKNLALNRTGNIRLHEIGIGASTGTCTLYGCDIRDIGSSSFLEPPGGMAREKLSVPVTTLDECFDDSVNVSVIKIDVQGFEQEVLRGARNLVSRDRPCILLEHEDSNFGDREQAQASKNVLRAFFDEAGYAVFYITRYDPDLLFPVAWDRPLAGNLLSVPKIT